MAVLTTAPFTGFRPEAIDFLAELAQNNERAWFQPRKADDERLLKEPLEALVPIPGLGMRALGWAVGVRRDGYTTGPERLVREFGPVRRVIGDPEEIVAPPRHHDHLSGLVQNPDFGARPPTGESRGPSDHTGGF